MQTPDANRKHNRRSIRLFGYDYSASGAYFITICTERDKAKEYNKHHFGIVVGKLMVLSEIGKIAKSCWKRIPEHFPNVELCEYVVMPNHLHALLIINSSRGAACRAPMPSHECEQSGHGEFGKPSHGGLSTVVRSYKSAVTRAVKYERGISVDRVWQRNYYEHVVRDSDDFDSIRGYIHDNPAKWEKDPLYR